MLSFAGSLKVFVCLEPMDMRKGFEGLHAAVQERLGEDVNLPRKSGQGKRSLRKEHIHAQNQTTLFGGVST